MPWLHYSLERAWYPLYRSLGGSQDMSGQRREDLLAPKEVRTLTCPACRKSLHWLHYSGPPQNRYPLYLPPDRWSQPVRYLTHHSLLGCYSVYLGRQVGLAGLCGVLVPVYQNICITCKKDVILLFTAVRISYLIHLTQFSCG